MTSKEYLSYILKGYGIRGLIRSGGGIDKSLLLHQLILQMAKLQAHEPSTGLQHPIGLLQNSIYMRAIPDTKGDGVGCVLIVLKGQLLCIRANPIDVTVFLEIQA